MFTAKSFTFWHSLTWKADINTSWSLGTNKNHTIRKFEMDMFGPSGCSRGTHFISVGRDVSIKGVLFLESVWNRGVFHH